MGLRWGLNDLRQLIHIKFLEQSSVLGKHLIYAYCCYYYILNGGEGTEQHVRFATICGGKKEASKNMYTCPPSMQTSICVYTCIYVLACIYNILQERHRKVENTDAPKEGSGCWWQERFFTAFPLLLVIFEPLHESFILTSAAVTGIFCRKPTQVRRRLPAPWFQPWVPRRWHSPVCHLPALASWGRQTQP